MQVFLWDVSTGCFIRKLRGHDSTINAVTHAANDDVLVTAGYDQCVKLWDMKSRSSEAMQVMKAFRVSKQHLNCSPRSLRDCAQGM